MTAAGQLLVLPALSPMPSRVREHHLAYYQSRARQTWQHRLYALPPRERQDILTYSPAGDADTENLKGLNIDIFA